MWYGWGGMGGLRSILCVGCAHVVLMMCVVCVVYGYAVLKVGMYVRGVHDGVDCVRCACSWLELWLLMLCVGLLR